MKPSIRYVIASREQGIAEVQFQVVTFLLAVHHYQVCEY